MPPTAKPQQPKSYTARQIAAEADAPRHVVLHWLDRRRHFPCTWIGATRAVNERQTAALLAELAKPRRPGRRGRAVVTPPREK